MDFDDLEDAEVAMGPAPSELREALLAKQVPEEMPGARKHPAPKGKGFGGGSFKSQRVLFLHGPGSTTKLCERQVQAMFKNVPWVVDFKIFEWDYWEGSIKYAVHEIHADPAVQEVFKPFGPDFFSYIVQANLNRQDEYWEFLDEVMDKLAKKLEADGPYDGLCGFDMGGGLAFTAARLAQEGDLRFAERFRYLMLFSTHGHKDLSLQGQNLLKPKAPLQIPTFMGWSEADDGRPYPSYEDLCMYIHPAYRGVILHDQGHRPPNIQKGTAACDELNRFVEDMQADVRYKPTASNHNALYKDYFLPLLREPAPPVPTGAPRILVVVSDPMGEHGPKSEDAADRVRFPAQEDPRNCALRLGICRAARGLAAADFRAAAGARAADPPVDVVEAVYSAEHRSVAWLPKAEKRDVSVAYVQGAGRSRWVQPEDEVVLPWTEIRRIAAELVESVSVTRGDNVGIVGVGTGSVIAVAMAEEMLKTRNVQPIGLWALCAPTVWPTLGAPQLGALVTTPICYLIPPSAVCGPPWRLETATFGPFATAAFETKEEALKTIFDGLAAAGSAPA